MNSDTPVIKTGFDAIMYVGRLLVPETPTSPGFSLSDPKCLDMYKKAYYIFSNNQLIEKFGMSSRKGILLTGDLGVGKSTVMDVMQRLFTDTDRRFRSVTGRELRIMLDDFKASDIMEMYGKQMLCDLYLDDIGIGQVNSNKYGNWVNIIAELLFDRYELFTRTGYKTHLSTNLPVFKYAADGTTENTNSLEHLFGDRVTDRLKEMTNYFNWEGKSLRGGQK